MLSRAKERVFCKRQRVHARMFNCATQWSVGPAPDVDRWSSSCVSLPVVSMRKRADPRGA